MTEDPFVAHRSLLFTVTYEMLGSAADAEDILQEAWLRWADIDHSQVRDPRAYLIRVVMRQALNQMRTPSRRREEYVGEWLPEPLLTTVLGRRRTSLSANATLAARLTAKRRRSCSHNGEAGPSDAALLASHRPSLLHAG